jgi:hypothetical protein
MQLCEGRGRVSGFYILQLRRFGQTGPVFRLKFDAIDNIPDFSSLVVYPGFF